MIRIPFELRVDFPARLADALAARGAVVVSVWREPPRAYVRAKTPDTSVFARYTTDHRDEATLAHEVEVRRIIGSRHDLRAPAILERGSSWLLEQAVASEPCAGAPAIDAIAAAAAALPELRLHDGPARRNVRGLASVRRTVRLAHSPLPVRDQLAARRVLARPDLPLVTSHGDFHTNNVLLAEGTAWVVDWELSGRAPAGFDLMQMWATLEREDDRERLFEAAVRQVGRRRRWELSRLRYAVVVRTLAGLLSGPEFERDPVVARRLLALLPEMRIAAD